MTDYYVRKTGSDANDGTNPSTEAWLTIDKAANTVAAGDTVYVGAGVYRELVTMDTAGTDDTTNRISFIADIDGSKTGDAGLVVVSAHDSDTGAAQRAACWTFATALDPKFITVRGFVMQGGTTATINHSSASGDNSYEGLIIEDCTILGGADGGDDGIILAYNAGAVPTGDGVRIRRCIFKTATYDCLLQWDENATAERDIDALIENCLFLTSANNSYAIRWDLGSTSTYDLVGLKVHNCAFLGNGGLFVDNGSSTSTPVVVYNGLFYGCQNGLNSVTTSGQITSDYNTFIGCTTPYTNVTQGVHDRTNSDATEVPAPLLGALADLPFRAKMGWSPWLPFEPIYLQGGAMSQSVVGDADSTYAPADDLYGNPRPMGAPGYGWSIYHFDASDAGPTDNEGTWTDDANAFNGATATTATTVTSGTETNDELRGEGTNAPATGGTISAVEYRIYTGTVGTQNWRIYTDGEAESLANSSTTADDTWSAWATLTVPSGGWTWTKVAALELVLWASAQPGEVGAVQVRVSHAGDNLDDRGAVETRARPEQETTTVRTGSNAIRFEGAGYHDFLIPVAAQSTTITVYGYFDATYTGTLPSMTVTNDDIMTEVTDTMTVAAGNWEQLTSGAFTPSAAGVVRVRVRSSDTSAAGECFFDDLVVT